MHIETKQFLHLASRNIYFVSYYTYILRAFYMGWYNSFKTQFPNLKKVYCYMRETFDSVFRLHTIPVKSIDKNIVFFRIYKKEMRKIDTPEIYMLNKQYAL